MRDRLIELIKATREDCNKANCGYCGLAKFGGFPDCEDKRLADYLLENGVIVPPCKVGQTVFKIVKLYGDRKPIIVEGEVFEIAFTHENGEIKKRFYFLEKGGNKIINRYSLWLDFDEVGKTVFLAEEKAEQALKGGVQE